MSFSKQFKGTFEEVRQQIHLLKDEVLANDEKNSATDGVKEGHALQAESGAQAAEFILARLPHRHNAEGQQITININGHANADASGQVGVSYSFPKATASKATASEAI